jgi:hypothetical protein
MSNTADVLAAERGTARPLADTDRAYALPAPQPHLA